MKCPNCKTKKKLQTIRTIDTGNTVKRHRHCTKCMQNVYTVEMTETAFNNTISILDKEINLHERTIINLEEKIERYQDFFNLWKDLTEKEEKHI